MIAPIQPYMQRLRQLLQRFRTDPQLHTILRISICLLAGFLLSAASLGNMAQPLVLGLLFATSGLPAVLIAAGGVCGYFVFWSTAGLQGAIWLAAGLPVALLLGRLPIMKTGTALLPAAAALVTAATGLFFLVQLEDATPIAIYLLRIALAGASARAFQASRQQDPIAQWLVWGLWILALAQITVFPWLSLGTVAAGALCVAGAFPAAAVGGLALDLAGITTVPMTAVVCLAFFLRLIPFRKKWPLLAGPGLTCMVVMALCQTWDSNLLPGLFLGGTAGLFLPGQPKAAPRRGETGVAQVRLEMAAGVFSQVQQLLLEMPQAPIDEDALLRWAAERACSGCSCRKTCPEREAAPSMPAQLLHRPLLDGKDLPISCRKEGRLLQELHRAQEQLRAMRADRDRQKECRAALIQQYHFLSEYLQDLSDQLSHRGPAASPRYKPEVAVAANRRESDNGDRCLRFPGVGGTYYVLLCDGMGTGLGAADEGKTAASILKRLLSAGFPADYALRSLNSLCALRGLAGASPVLQR